MGSLFRSTKNTRAILPGSDRFLRSDVPDRLTPEETEWLLTRNVRTVVDLRTPAERERRPCPLASDGRFRYLLRPVTGGDAVPAAPEDVAASYIRMADGAMRRLLDELLHAPTGVLYFCGAGKDRTGVVSALLLRALGRPDEEILADYLLSGENLKESLEAYAKADPSADLRVITPCRAYMERFLAWLDREENGRKEGTG